MKSKLTDSALKEKAIKTLNGAHFSVKQISELFSMSPNTIYKVLKGRPLNARAAHINYLRQLLETAPDLSNDEIALLEQNHSGRAKPLSRTTINTHRKANNANKEK